MDRFLWQWQKQNLPRRRRLSRLDLLHGARPQRNPRRRPSVRTRMAKRHVEPVAEPVEEQDEGALVTVEAAQVTVVGTPRDLERFAAAAGLYGEVPHARRMSKDEDHIMTGVYIGLGILLAAGAGYAAWRWLLSDEQKRKAINVTKDLVADGLTAGKRAVRDAREKVHL